MSAADSVVGHAGLAGLASMRSEIAAATADLAASHLRWVLEDQQRHATCVAHGAYHWRLHLIRAFRPLPMDESLADGLFSFLTDAWERTYPGVDPKAYLNALHVPTPSRFDGIVTDWKVESASSTESVRTMYGGLHPQEWLDRVMAEDRRGH